ncbi:MAG TPA: glycosyltransferase family 39 protein [Thermoanaerobaculia bacterium]|nr:glycosyltransferase family 39 protein [Thermoanaerobaculia bacterium]
MSPLSIRIALRLAVLAHLGFLLGLLGLLKPPVVIVTTLAVIFPWERRRPAGQVTRQTFLLLLLLPLLILALYPPTAFDEIMYHLPFAKAFAESGGLPATPALRFPVFPALSEVLAAQVLLLSNDVATHLISLLAVLTTAGLLLTWGREAFSPQAGWIAAALWLGNPIVVHLGGTGYVEPLLTLFITGALYSAWRCKQSGETSWLLLAALFAGTAAGVKYLGLFFAAAVFVYLAVARRKPFLFAIAAFLVLAPTYIRIAAHTGNPIFPYLPSLFGSTPWDPIALKPAAELLSMDTVIRFLRLPWDVVVHRSAVGQQPPFSPFYLLLLLGLGDPRVRRFLVLPLVWAIVFLFLPPDSRYLVLILPLLSLALAGTIRIEKRSLLAAVCILAILPGWLYASYRIAKQGPPPVTAEQRDRYLTRKLPLYPAIRELDRISDVAYAFNAEHMKYFYEGPLYGDWIGPVSYRRLKPLVRHPEALHHELRKLGATHLLMSKVPNAIRPAANSNWEKWFRKVRDNPAADIYELAK